MDCGIGCGSIGTRNHDDEGGSSFGSVAVEIRFWALMRVQTHVLSF